MEGSSSPRRNGRNKALAALGGSLAALALLGAGLVRLGFLGGNSVAAADPAERAALPFPPVLDESGTRRHFSIADRPDICYDPLSYVTHLPDSTSRFTWKEHPEGRFVRRVNNLAFNEDEPTRVEKRGLRVLVAGDSHTAGLVNPAETFSNVAERALQRALGRQDVEVLNAGVGYTGPTCYLGMLQKHLALQPDVFVAVLFTGNDFLDEIFLAYAARRGRAPDIPDEYGERIEPVVKSHSGPLWQGLNQAYRWKWFPPEIELASRSALDAYRAMKRLCDERGIRFLAVLLPTKMDVDEDDRETWHAAMGALGLSEEDVRLDLEVGRRLLAAARAEGIETLDPTDAMIESREVLYWQADYHLGVAGHALLGELLAASLAQLL